MGTKILPATPKDVAVLFSQYCIPFCRTVRTPVNLLAHSGNIFPDHSRHQSYICNKTASYPSFHCPKRFKTRYGNNNAADLDSREDIFFLPMVLRLETSLFLIGFL
jgi:hypothetical protein